MKKKIVIVLLAVMLIINTVINIKNVYAIELVQRYKYSFIVKVTYPSNLIKFICIQSDNPKIYYSDKKISKFTLNDQNVIDYTLFASDNVNKDVKYDDITNWIETQHFTEINFTDELIEIVKSDMTVYDINGENVIYTPPPTQIEWDFHEYALITNPYRDGYKTIDKNVLVRMAYRISCDENPVLEFKMGDGTSFKDNTNIESYTVEENVINTTAEGFKEGYVGVLIKFKKAFIGPVSIHGCVYSTKTNENYNAYRNFEIIPFTDSNGDGKSDDTGEDVYVPPSESWNDGNYPVRSSYPEGIIGDLQFGFDRLLYYITYPFVALAKLIGQLISFLGEAMEWVSQISGLFGVLFGFLPPEMVGLLTTAFTILIIAFILRLFARRG